MQWWEKYEALNLFGGKISYIGDDLEDMIEISYPDGLFIDVGKLIYDGLYHITVYHITGHPYNEKYGWGGYPQEEPTDGWDSPLAEITIINKDQLFDSIQKVITDFRDEKT